MVHPVKAGLLEEIVQVIIRDLQMFAPLLTNRQQAGRRIVQMMGDLLLDRQAVDLIITGHLTDGLPVKTRKAQKSSFLKRRLPAGIPTRLYGRMAQ